MKKLTSLISAAVLSLAFSGTASADGQMADYKERLLERDISLVQEGDAKSVPEVWYLSQLKQVLTQHPEADVVDGDVAYRGTDVEDVEHYAYFVRIVDAGEHWEYTLEQ